MLEEVETKLSCNGFASKSQESGNFLLSKVPKQQWINLTYMDQIIARNQIKLKDYDEEANALPFFMNFGDSLLEQMKDELEGNFIQKNNKESKIIKKRDDNEFLDESVDDLEKLLNLIPKSLMQLPNSENSNLHKTFDSLFEILKSLSSFEIDHFIKKQTMFESENCIRFLKFFSYLFKNKKNDFDFKSILLKTFLESGADQLIQLRKNSPITKDRVLALLKEIHMVLIECHSENEDSFMEVMVVLERLANQTSDLPL